MYTLSIINQKGGVGKTTTVTNLAYNLSKKKKRVLVMDCDPQGNASFTLGKVSQFEQAKTIDLLLTDPDSTVLDVIVPSQYERIDFIPCNLDSSSAVYSMDAGDPMRFIGFKTKLEECPDIQKRYDFILIDCPPQIDSVFLSNGLIISDYYIIPIDTESAYALHGVQGLLKAVNKIRRTINKELKLLGALMTMYDSRTKASTFVSSSIVSLFGREHVFETKIHRNTVIGRATIAGKCVCDFDDRCPGCVDYRALAAEVLKRVGQAE